MLSCSCNAERSPEPSILKVLLSYFLRNASSMFNDTILILIILQMLLFIEWIIVIYTKKRACDLYVNVVA
jgi:hypothetical protein